MPNEIESAPQKALLTDLKAARESLALDLAKAQKLDERAQDSGERWTLGLRASQFARELRNARAHLSVASVIWGRLGFVIDQISAESANDGKEPAQASAAA